MPDLARDTDWIEHYVYGLTCQSHTCSTCLGPYTTPILHAQCEAVRAGGGIIMAKVINPYSPTSTSRSTPSAKNSSVKRSSTGPYPFAQYHAKFHGVALGTCGARPRRQVQSGKNLPQVISSVNGPPSPATKRNGGKAAPSFRSAESEDYWKNREESILRDILGTSGRLGPCLRILTENWNAAELTDVRMVDGDVPLGASFHIPPFATVATAGFSFGVTTSPGRGVGSFMDERFVSDPNLVGLEGLDLFCRDNFEEGPTSMDQEYI